MTISLWLLYSYTNIQYISIYLNIIHIIDFPPKGIGHHLMDQLYTTYLLYMLIDC